MGKRAQTKLRHESYLGKRAYIVREDGEIIATIVNEVGEGYCNVSGRKEVGDLLPDFTFDLGDATRQAVVIIKKQEQEAEAALTVIKEKLRKLENREYLQVSDTKDVQVDTPEFEPGGVVYSVVTPKDIQNFRHMASPYFVAEGRVHCVLTAPFGGSVNYYVPSTGKFNVTDPLFAKVSDAKQRLMDVFAKETGGAIALKDIPVFRNVV